MKCHKVRRLLSRMIDGELDTGVMEAMAAHLEVCSECRVEFEQIKRDRELLLSAGLPELPDYFVTRTIAQVRESDVKRMSAGQPAGLLWRVAFVLFVAIGLGVGIIIGAGIGGNGGSGGELATINAVPSIEELFAGGE